MKAFIKFSPDAYYSKSMNPHAARFIRANINYEFDTFFAPKAEITGVHF